MRKVYRVQIQARGLKDYMIFFGGGGGNSIILSNIAKNTGPRIPRLDFKLTPASNYDIFGKNIPVPSVVQFLLSVK